MQLNEAAMAKKGTLKVVKNVDQSTEYVAYNQDERTHRESEKAIVLSKCCNKILLKQDINMLRIIRTRTFIPW